MNNKKITPITGKEHGEILELANYFNNYPISYFSINAVKQRLCDKYGYSKDRDKFRLTELAKEVTRERMTFFAQQNPGYEKIATITHRSSTTWEEEDVPV